MKCAVLDGHGSLVKNGTAHTRAATATPATLDAGIAAGTYGHAVGKYYIFELQVGTRFHEEKSPIAIGGIVPKGYGNQFALGKALDGEISGNRQSTVA